jgi:hypothetical protein
MVGVELSQSLANNFFEERRVMRVCAAVLLSSELNSPLAQIPESTALLCNTNGLDAIDNGKNTVNKTCLFAHLSRGRDCGGRCVWKVLMYRGVDALC